MKYASLTSGVVDAFNDVLNMPLYGEGSVQELAKKYNIDIPESDYKDGWDVATELVAAHYEGSENYPLYEKDIKILFFAGVNDGIIPKAVKTGGFLSDIEREFLLLQGAELAPTTRERIYNERFY